MEELNKFIRDIVLEELDENCKKLTKISRELLENRLFHRTFIQVSNRTFDLTLFSGRISLLLFRQT